MCALEAGQRVRLEAGARPGEDKDGGVGAVKGVRRTSARGTTLLEIVITMAIMTVGMLGFFTLHFRSLQISKASVTMSQATTLASSYQDMLLSIPYSDLFSGSAALQPCAPEEVPPVEDLCYTFEDGPVNAIGTRNVNANMGTLHFTPSYAIELLEHEALRITVRVRYPDEIGRCPTCSKFQRGWKVIDLVSTRAMTAY